MTQEELNELVNRYHDWACRVDVIECPSFHGLDLHGLCLSNATLAFADLSCTDLRGTDLRGTDLRCADLSCANLKGALLEGAKFDLANLTLVELSDSEKYRLGLRLKEPMTGYKRTNEGVVLTAEIPVGAMVYCINGKKCRTDKAKIVDMGGARVLHSIFDPSFSYQLGQEIQIPDFDTNYNTECGAGFHFFRTRKEAEEYDLFRTRK